MIVIENDNEEVYACGENLKDVIRSWNFNIDMSLQWLIEDLYEENYDFYYNLTRPVETFDEIISVLIEINDYYPEESCIIKFE